MADLDKDYQTRLSAGDIEPDPAQADAIRQLDALSVKLSRRSGLFSRAEPPKGLYMWGDVGRGKSMLMDLFHDHAPVKRKRRVHFHDFMLEAHEFVGAWRKLDQNERRRRDAHVRGAGDDPIPPTAKHLATNARLLCFDEFHVTDIADAMILGRLFEQLFARDVVIVATSNRHPDDLYKNGINRQLFLPFIAQLKEKMDILELSSARDYRLERLGRAPVYQSPLGAAADQDMDAAWKRMTNGETPSPMKLNVQGREISVPRHAAGCARFDFSELCDTPLGAADYLAIARRFHTVFLDHTPILSPANRNAAARFVKLVDALYEAKTKLVISAAAEPDHLYPTGDGAFEFQRTASRLHEMRSTDYLAAERASLSLDVA